MKMRGCEKTSSCPEKKVDFDKSLINNDKQSVFKTMCQGKKLVTKEVNKGRFVVTKVADDEGQMVAKEFDNEERSARSANKSSAQQGALRRLEKPAGKASSHKAAEQARAGQ